MKEKRVDIYLAKAGFYQLLFLGTGGAAFTEAMQDTPRIEILYITCLFSAVFVALVFRYYLKADSLSKKSKKINL